MTRPHFEELQERYSLFWSKYYYFRKSAMWLLHHLDKLDEKRQSFIDKVYKPLRGMYDDLPESMQDDLDPLMFVGNAFMNAIKDPIEEQLKDITSWVELMNIAERKAKEACNERLSLPSSKESA